MRPTYFKTQGKNEFSNAPAVEYRNRDTMHAWESFVEYGEEGCEIRNAVRSEILASWIRCANSGVSALNAATPRIINDSGVDLLRKKSRTLREAAAPVFKRLAQHLAGTGAMLILTDRNGTVIETKGDSRTIENGREIQLEIGGVWDENTIGTNGIGTALSTGRPTYVHASEHFCLGIKDWSCVGVPIIDALDRSVIGVVDLSGPSGIYHAHNIALMASAAREIELNLAQRQLEEHTALLEEFISISRRHARDNIIILLNSAGRVVYSRNAEGLTNGDSTNLENFDIGTRMLDIYPDMPADELLAEISPTMPARDIDLIKVNGRTQGIALFLDAQSYARSDARHSGVTIKPRFGILEDEMEIVGESAGILKSIEFAHRASSMKVPVLILGETGVGKELFARMIHGNLAEAAAPYVAVNCATMSADLIRRELFGCAAGSGAGAGEGKLGKFEQADSGVLCLDEIGDMPVELQTYLLRALEQRTVYRVGCDIRRPVDVLPISISSRNLRDDTLDGRFRRDLYYRIGTIVIDIPPLRERGNDIDHLIEFFNRKLSRKYDRDMLEIDADSMGALRRYQWPGNVRELRNTIEKLYVLTRDRSISLAELPVEIVDPYRVGGLPAMGSSYPSTASMSLEEIESLAIQRSIEMAKGNLAKAAVSLGISRPTIYRKIKRYGLER